MYQVGAGVLSREEGNTLVCMNSQEYYVNSGEVMVISITVTDQGYKPFLFHPNNLVVEEPGPGNGILYAYGNPSFSFYVVSQGGSNPPKRWSDGHCTTGWFVHYVGHSPVQ